MALDLAALPDDVGALRALVAAQAAALAAKDAELAAQHLLLDRLRVQLARLRRMQFGRSSERLRAEIEQLELTLEDLEAEAPGTGDDAPTGDGHEAARPARNKPKRRPLPDYLPREVVEHAAPDACPACGGSLRPLGEDVTEVLDWVPGRFRVVRHVRPKCSCRRCEAISQAPAPSLPIERGRAGAGLLAHVLVSKYADHLPLYRQAEILACEGVGLSRSTLADWVGQCAALLRPLVDALERHVMAGSVLHAGDTPVPVLAPGIGKTQTGRLWAYVRDERPWAGDAPSAVLYRYTPDRRGEHPRGHLAGFQGVLQADGYAGLYAGEVAEAACWAHVRCKFFDSSSTCTPPAKPRWPRRPCSASTPCMGSNAPSPGARLTNAPGERQARAGPLLDALQAWLTATLARVPGRGDLAGAIRHALTCWAALTRYRDDGTSPWTTRPSAPFDRSRLGAKTGCSEDQTPAASLRPGSCRSCKALG